MKKTFFLKFAILAPLLIAATVHAQDKVPLKTDLPPPLFVGTPVPINVPNLEPKVTKWPEFMVPAGTTNLALGKKVTASDSDPVVGTLDLVTDGDKAAMKVHGLNLGPASNGCKLIWRKRRIFMPSPSGIIIRRRGCITMWSCKFPMTRLSAPGVTTVYDNSASGTDHPYIETNFGKLIDAKGVKGRYVRLYSNGNTTNKLNHYIEVEVFGKPAA